jgi:phage terminase large subunit-like protein
MAQPMPPPRMMPVAALYEQGRVKHVGSLALLEDQMYQFTGHADGKSPDRVAARVWVLTELNKAARGRELGRCEIIFIFQYSNKRIRLLY